MRISDWSSDVCSSDLADLILHRGFGIERRRRVDRARRRVLEAAALEAARHHRIEEMIVVRLEIQAAAIGDVVPALLRGNVEEFVPAQRRHAARVGDAVGLVVARLAHRSEERRVGKERVSTCRARWSPLHNNKKLKNKTARRY